MASATRRQSRRPSWAVASAAVAALALSGCTPSIAQVRPTQLALFCLVHQGDSKHAVYGLVGNPTVSGADGAAVPPVFRSWHVPYRASPSGFWAAWMGQTAYLASFERNREVRLDRRFKGHTVVGWTC